jgi:DNA repair protein RadD
MVPIADIAIDGHLRPYQQVAVANVEAQAAAGYRRILLVAPTGAGKTHLASELIRKALAKGRRVLFVAHRRELIKQAHLRLFETGIDAGVIAPEFTARPGEPVQVASIPTLYRRALASSRLQLPAADIVFVDEAHHARAPTWQRLIESYPNAVIIGLTATPCRQDGAGLGEIFEKLVETKQIPELIDQGFLVGTRVFAPSSPDLEGIHIRRGDYVESELAKRVDLPKLIGDVVGHWLRHAERKRTVCFCVGVAHAVHLRDEFRRHDVAAEYIDGNTPIPERDAILSRLKAGAVEVVCNCNVLTEGWDLPQLGCVILARPSKSFGLYRQMTGRGLRPFSDKTHLLVLDHAGLTLEHGFVEEPVVWSLDKDRRAHATRASKSSTGAAERKLVDCPECHRVFWRDAGVCPSCGWRPRPKPKAIAVRPGDLVEVKHRTGQSFSADDKRDFLGELHAIQRERGYKPGWSYHTFIARFGHPPLDPVLPPPRDPSSATRGWVKHRQIAYAKARRA